MHYQQQSCLQEVAGSTSVLNITHFMNTHSKLLMLFAFKKFLMNVKTAQGC